MSLRPRSSWRCRRPPSAAAWSASPTSARTWSPRFSPCSAGSSTPAAGWPCCRSRPPRSPHCPPSGSLSGRHRGLWHCPPRSRHGGRSLQSRPGGHVSAAFTSMKTYSAKPGEVARDWYVVDAEGKTLGRLATQIADVLRGKRKAAYTPHVDTGDFVVVVNAEKIQVTGSKLDDKMYHRHSGYPGGLKSRTLREQLQRQPTEVLRKAVKGMLPKNRLARQQLGKLKIYAGPEHPHQAQAPKPFELK